MLVAFKPHWPVCSVLLNWSIATFLTLFTIPGILGTRVAMYVMLALIIGALFWDLGESTTLTSIYSRIALLFYCVAFFVVRLC